MKSLDAGNAKILIVEDTEGYLERIINRLSKFGYLDLDVARTEDEAKIKLEHGLYDVIVADMRLKQFDNTDKVNESGGFAVVEEVSRRNITSVVIVLTFNDSVNDCRKALKGGRCWDYIPKGLVEGSALDELHRSIQEGLAYLNRWGNRHDEAWIHENKEQLLNTYRGKYIAVINNSVIESADTEDALKQQIQERKLPLFLPVIRKIEIESPHGVPVAELLKWKDREDNLVEFKSTLEWDVRENKKNSELIFSTLKTIAAFLNSEGGTLLIGVEDEKNIYGLKKDFSLLKEDRQTPDGFELKLRDLIKANIGGAFTASEYIRIRFEELEGKTVCAADVLKSPEPAFLKSKKSNAKEFYIRTGNSTNALDVEQMYLHLRMRKWF